MRLYSKIQLFINTVNLKSFRTMLNVFLKTYFEGAFFEYRYRRIGKIREN